MLSIENSRKSPQYTTDYYHLSLKANAGVALLDVFCRAQCYCKGEKQEDINARVSEWNKQFAYINDAMHQQGEELHPSHEPDFN